MYFPPQPFSAEILVSAAVSVVFPWSTCPIVPTFTWGLVRSNLALAMVPCPLEARVKTQRRKDAKSSVTAPHAVYFASLRLCVSLASPLQARDRNRTGDLILTKDALYRLSYASGVRRKDARTQRVRSPHLTLSTLRLCVLASSLRLPQAGDGTRTRDPQLGRLMLYQLSYTRERRRPMVGEGFEPS